MKIKDSVILRVRKVGRGKQFRIGGFTRTKDGGKYVVEARKVIDADMIILFSKESLNGVGYRCEIGLGYDSMARGLLEHASKGRNGILGEHGEGLESKSLVNNDEKHGSSTNTHNKSSSDKAS